MQEAKAEKESLEAEMQRTKDEMATERKRADEAEKELIRLRAELEKLRKQMKYIVISVVSYLLRAPGVL